MHLKPCYSRTVGSRCHYACFQVQGDCVHRGPHQLGKLIKSDSGVVLATLPFLGSVRISNVGFYVNLNHSTEYRRGNFKNYQEIVPPRSIPVGTSRSRCAQTWRWCIILLKTNSAKYTVIIAALDRTKACPGTIR